MRRIAFIVCLSLLPDIQARGQVAMPEKVAESAQPAPTSADPSPWSKRVRAPDEHPTPEMERWHLDLLAGLPLGLRLQAPLHTTTDAALVAEAFAGLYIIVPTVGAGLRYRQTVLESARGRLTIGPGVDAYGLHIGGTSGPTTGEGWVTTRPTSTGVIAADVDIVWQSTSGGRDTMFGLKLGGGEAFGRGTMAVPIFAFFGSWQF